MSSSSWEELIRDWRLFHESGELLAANMTQMFVSPKGYERLLNVFEWLLDHCLADSPVCYCLIGLAGRKRLNWLVFRLVACWCKDSPTPPWPESGLWELLCAPRFAHQILDYSGKLPGF